METQVNNIEKGLWFTDHKSHVYFHWILDSLERAEMSIDYQRDYQLLVLEQLFKKEFVRESLKFLQYNYVVLKSNELYKIKELIIASKTAETGNYNVSILQDLINRFKKISNYEAYSEYENLFVYRNSSIGRNINDQEKLESLLKKYNFKLIEFENFSFNEKINILRNCKNLMGIFGSGLTNMIFLNKNSNLIEIRHYGDKTNNAFFFISFCCWVELLLRILLF